MASSTTRFVNKTRHMVKVQVGNNHHCSNLASIKGGGEFKLHVNMNDTYREFSVGVEGIASADSTKRVIVTSDDCCEFKCITIQEVGGEIELRHQRRTEQPTPQPTVVSGSPSASKKKSCFSWRMWAYCRVSS